MSLAHTSVDLQIARLSNVGISVFIGRRGSEDSRQESRRLQEQALAKKAHNECINAFQTNVKEYYYELESCRGHQERKDGAPDDQNSVIWRCNSKRSPTNRGGELRV